MNTIWTGKTEEYPIKKEKAEIISGEGEITKRTEKNAKREYHISAKTPVRLADYTFYFPGWNVYVDGKKTPIEFQDPNYRGVITYTVPEGEHTIHVILENTKVRLLGSLVTVFGLISLAVLFILKKRIKKHLHLSY